MAGVRPGAGMSTSVTINTRQYETALRRALNRQSDDVKRALVRTGIDVENDAKRRCPVDTGRLRSSIVHRIDGAGRVAGITVGTNVNYAWDVENGTPPHVIVPKNKRALYWPGAAHPVARVNHPGTRAQPFMRPALELAPIFFSKNLRKIQGR